MTEDELLKAGYRKYTGEDIDVYFNLGMCWHSGNCIRGHDKVFCLNRRPWIKADEAVVEEVVKVVDCCPSGALKYIRK